MRAILACLASCLAFAAPARAQSIPARSGERGILDVPDAEVSGVGGGQLAAELRLDRVAGQPSDVGPLPLYAVMGVTSKLDAGLTMREWGQPGDPRPSKVLFGAAAKLQLVSAAGTRPGVALSTVLDRMNERSVAGARVALSSAAGPLKLAGYAGAESATGSLGSPGFTAGAAMALALTPSLDLAVDGITGPRGESYGAALRLAANRTTGVAFGVSYLPRDEGLRFAVTLAFSPAPRRPEAAKAAPAPEQPEAPVTAPGAPRFADDRVRFKLRIPTSGPSEAQAGRHQYAPYAGPAVAAASAVRPAGPARAVAPSLEDLAEAQIRESEALVDARQRRVRSTAEQLDQREKAAAAEAARLKERERELAAREQQLDEREKRIAGVKASPTQQQRQLESLEAQLAAGERNLSAQERSLEPSIDAALGRERDAAARQDAERQEANRLSASAGAASSRALQLEIRKQALGSRNRELAAQEARLVARGERIDALERQLRAKAERLDAWSRRLDTRADRLDLLERRATEARQQGAAPRPTDGAAAAPKDKAVFVMVVKSPTAIMQERAAAPAAGATGAALHPGVAVEKAVAAATVVVFPSPTSRLSELDGETLDKIAKLAAKERCELLVWARAKDPGLMAEAQRRAAELRTRALAAGPLDEKQVVTRITTRPGAQGVDVVVSALRESAKPAPVPEGPRAQALLPGESGKRQIREAVQGAQASIEACVGEVIAAGKLARAEAVLKLTVSTQGRVSKVVAAEGALAGSQIEDCLGAASGGWSFPPAEAEYVVEVPITVIRGGAAK